MVLAAMFFVSFLKDHPVREINASSGGSTVTLVGSSTRGRPWNRQLKQFSAALALITTVLMIRLVKRLHCNKRMLTCMFRAVYRTIELADGWNGPVISTQRWFSKSILSPSSRISLTRSRHLRRYHGHHSYVHSEHFPSWPPVVQPAAAGGRHDVDEREERTQLYDKPCVAPHNTTHL